MLNIEEVAKSIAPSARKIRESKGIKKKPKNRSSNSKSQSIRSSQAAISRDKHNETREIGSLPAIVNPDRRAQCKLDFKYHCYTYLGATFCLEFAQIHEDAITKLLSALHNGSDFLYVMPRGTGKSSILKGIIHFGVSHGFLKLPTVFCSSEEKVIEFMDALKVWFTIGVFAEDFPEIAYPVIMLDGVNARAPGQILNGEHTNIKWDKKQLRLPTVDGADASGTVIQGKSMSSKDIRGIAKTMSDGSTARPDFVAIDDPQTDEGAANPKTCRKIIKAINKTIRGMKGPGVRMGLAIAATVIEENDAIHQMLNIDEYPELRGMHVKMMPSMPDNIDIWTNEYREFYKKAFSHDPPDFTEANDFYKSNHSEMTKGAESSWPERYEPHQIDAIQYAMHAYLQDEEAFWSEYQNEPGEYINDDDIRLRVDDVLSNLNGLDRNHKPAGYEIDTMGIDLNDYGLNCARVLTMHDMTGIVVDYFKYNPPGRDFIYKKDHDLQIEVEFANAIMNLVKREHMKHPEMIFGIDGNYQTSTVYKCIDTLKALGINVYAVRGRGYRQYKEPDKGNKRTIKLGTNSHYWYGKQGREIVMNSDWWHVKTQSAFKITNPGRGSLSLWGKNQLFHRDFAMECTVDMYKSINYDDWLNMYEYVRMPGRNDKFDATSIAQVVANMQGASFDADVTGSESKRKRRELNKKSKMNIKKR
jgi:hypothetical protein